jgi:Meckel syndrome type 1 protein
VYPDFNDVQANPYFLEIDLDSRRMFDYGIKNLSENQDEDGKLQPQVSDLVDKLTKVALHHHAMDNFALPPRKCQTVFLSLQFLSAKNFEYDNIHIRYQLNVPQQCKVLEGNLRGSTHSSKKLGNLWNFGYCCDWSLQCSSDFNADDSISINFELISVDSWERERTEGSVRC